MVSLTSTHSRPLTLNELVSRFLHARHDLSPKTQQYYKMCLSGLEFFANLNRWLEPEAITREHLRDFMDYLISEPHRWAGYPDPTAVRRARGQKRSAVPAAPPAARYSLRGRAAAGGG